MSQGWIIDPGSAQFDLNDLSSTYVRSQQYPPPAPVAQYVSAIDVDGDSLYSQRYPNRQITLQVEVKGSTPAALETALGNLQQKVATINREAVIARTGVGGTLQHTTKNNTVVTFDVCAITITPDLSETYWFGNLATVTLLFDCLPYGRGAEVTFGSHTESTLPVLIFTETGVTGDAPGEGRLQLTGPASDQYWFTWGVQSRYYDSASSAALFYEAESRTALGGGAAPTAATGASGAGSNAFLANSLSPVMQAIMSTQASGGGAQLSHVGDFRVYCRVQAPSANSGTVSVAWQWAAGDFRSPTTNSTVSLANTGGTWRLVDLGLVHIPPVATGTQQWEGRLLAESTKAGDSLYVDHFMLVPTAEGSGVASAQLPTASPTSFTARDEFDQTSGALNGKSAPVGGTWATSGSTTDFTVSGSGTVTRNSSLDTGTGRFAASGVGASAAQAAQVDFACNSSLSVMVDVKQGAVARFTDSSNYAYGGIKLVTGQVYAFAEVVVAGTAVISTVGATPLPIDANATWTARIAVDAAGHFWVWVAQQGAAMGTPLSGQHASLATGGALATGKPGIRDFCGFAGGSTRTYDNFAAWAPVADAAVFASKQAEIRSDRVIRQDSGGTIWASESSYQGDYLLVPPAGREGRSARILAKACRNDPATGADSAIDSLTGQLYVTPRYLQVPA